MISKFKIQVLGLLRGGFFHILFGNTLTKMIAFISSIVIVRLVSKEDYAYLAYADNLYSYANLVAGLGMSTAVLKFCSPNQENDKAYMMFAMKYGNIFQIALSFIIVIYASFVALPFPGARYLVITLAMYPVLTNIVTTIQNYVRAHLNNKLYVRISVVQTISVFGCSVVFVLGIGVFGIVVARYIAIVLSIIVAWKFLKSNLWKINSEKLKANQAKAFLAMALSMMIANLFSSMLANNEMALINYLISDEITTANYKVANLIPSQLTFVTSSVVVYYFPIISNMKVDKLVWNKVKRIGVFTGIIIIGITVFLMFFSPLIIELAYGNRYHDALGLFQLFWVVYCINAGFRMIPLNMLPALGITKFNAFLSVITCIVHFIIDYIFISYFGITGAGVASASVYLISGAIGWVYLHKICVNGEMGESN